ncbi:MAG: hypothetical protein KGI67_13790 [Pseudomonadota bacterium]|nr:hypothetical protein [Pseudomonadota bacterium]
MSVKFVKEGLSSAEASLLAWQFGASEDDRPFVSALWVALSNAWENEQRGDSMATDFLRRLGSAGAFPEEVATFRRFKSSEGEGYWLDLLDRAGLADRRQRDEPTPTERRRAKKGVASSD